MCHMAQSGQVTGNKPLPILDYGRSENGVENGMFWSEIGSGFGEPGGTPLPRIPRSTPSPRGIRPTCRHTGHVLLSVLECLSGEFHECRPCTWPHLR